MTLRQEQSAFTRDITRLLVYLAGKGYEVTLGEAHRTVDQQRLHIAAGRSLTMNSQHLKRLALDLNIFLDGRLIQTKAELQEIGDFWEGLDPGKNVWGGNWKRFVDTPHFERKGYWLITNMA